MVRASVCGIESAGSIPAIRPSFKVVVWSRGKTGACKALNGGSTPPTTFLPFDHQDFLKENVGDRKEGSSQKKGKRLDRLFGSPFFLEKVFVFSF